MWKTLQDNYVIALLREKDLPEQIGVSEFHLPSAPHVIEDNPSKLKPSLHLYETVEPTVKTSPIRVPFTGIPGSSHLETYIKFYKI